jgi:hypothetical protein
MNKEYTPEEYKNEYRGLYGGFKLMGMTDMEAELRTVLSMTPNFYTLADDVLQDPSTSAFCAYNAAIKYGTTVNKMKKIMERCLNLEFILLQYAAFCDGPIPEDMSKAEKMRLVRPQDPERYDDVYKRMILCGMTKKEANVIAMRLISPPDREDHIKKMGIPEEEYDKTIRAALKKYMKAEDQWFRTEILQRTRMPEKDKIILIRPPKGTDLLNDSVSDLRCKFCGHKTKYAYISVHGYMIIDGYDGEFWSYIDDEPACPECMKKAKE